MIGVCLPACLPERASRLRFDSILAWIHVMIIECLLCKTACSAIHDTSIIPAVLYFSPCSSDTTIYNGRYNQCSQWRLQEETVRSGKVLEENTVTCAVSFYVHYYQTNLNLLFSLPPFYICKRLTCCFVILFLSLKMHALLTKSKT